MNAKKVVAVPARKMKRGRRLRSRPAKRKRLGARKLAVSFEAPLAEQIQRAASQETSGNVSAWLAEAARQKIRQRALVDAVAAYEAEHGEITEDELAEVRQAWPPA